MTYHQYEHQTVQEISSIYLPYLRYISSSRSVLLPREQQHPRQDSKNLERKRKGSRMTARRRQSNQAIVNENIITLAVVSSQLHTSLPADQQCCGNISKQMGLARLCATPIFVIFGRGQLKISPKNSCSWMRLRLMRTGESSGPEPGSSILSDVHLVLTMQVGCL